MSLEILSQEVVNDEKQMNIIHDRLLHFEIDNSELTPEDKENKKADLLFYRSLVLSIIEKNKKEIDRLLHLK